MPTAPSSKLAATSAHRRTYDAIFRHPLSHTIPWREVHALLREIASVEEQPNGHLKVTRHGQTLVLATPATKDVSEASELMELRHFLERSEMPQTAPDASEAHWLVVIDHQQARIFRSELRGALPEQILPRPAEDYFRHAHNSQDFARAMEKPDPNSYFGPIARALAVTLPGTALGKILLFGRGKGTSSEMDQFTLWLKERHPEISRRVVGAVVVDAQHLTDAQLLAKAREFYAAHSGSTPQLQPV
jgi:hypothetical protein